MRLLTLAYPAASDFLSAYDDASRTLLAQTKTEATSGEQLLVEIAFPKLPNRPLLRATCRGTFAGGLRLELDAGDADTSEFLVKVAKGTMTDHAKHREHKRFPSALPVQYAMDGVRKSSQVEDLSAGGCFVRADRPPPVGAMIALDIQSPEENQPMHLTGQVAWVRDGRDPGFGVEFDAPETPDGKRLRMLLRKAVGSGDIDLE
jgi:uncharacterized protein (TIGR02266 family)